VYWQKAKRHPKPDATLHFNRVPSERKDMQINISYYIAGRLLFRCLDSDREVGWGGRGYCLPGGVDTHDIAGA